MPSWRTAALAAAAALLAAVPATASAGKGGGHHGHHRHGHDAPGLWEVYDDALAGARYIDLTHDITPGIPVWKGFGPAVFSPTVDPTTNLPYTYAEHGFEATAYQLATDQFGTQLDPPAHWAPEYPSISELPADLRRAAAGRDLDRRGRCSENPTYHLQVSDILRWEWQHGRIPAGSVVMVRSDWSKKWTEDPVAAKALAADPNFPGVSLAALQFLHLQAAHPVPRPRAARHGHHADARGRVLADAQRLHAGRGRGEPRRRAGDGLPDLDGLPEVQGRPRRLRALRRDLPARTPRPASRSPRPTPRCRRASSSCTGTRRWATASAGRPALRREGCPLARGRPSHRNVDSPMQR